MVDSVNFGFVCDCLVARVVVRSVVVVWFCNLLSVGCIGMFDEVGLILVGDVPVGVVRAILLVSVFNCCCVVVVFVWWIVSILGL